jgi:hypothetical protein
MPVFSTKVVQLAGAPPDPAKHVRFTDGMILGVDDFTQEFAYLSNRDRWLARDLIGYGTVSGLRVWIEDTADGPRVVVEPGVAVTPRGELVRVPAAQCASLKEWLAASDQVDYLSKRPVSASPPGDRLDIYVTLCYRECEIDDVPIPGEPCRHDDDMTAPSRILDDFRLELRLTPPEQPDEAAIRDFVEWLSAIPIVDGASTMALAQFLDELRKGAFLIGSPPSPPDFMYGVPPPSLQIGRADVCRYLRGAYRVWATELRPRWNASWWQGQSRCDGSRTDAAATTPEACLLLAHLDAAIAPTALLGPRRWAVPDASSVIVDESQRPVLVPLRMLQEWLWCGRTRAGDTAGAAVVAAGSVVVGQPASGPFQLQAADEGGGIVRVSFGAFQYPAHTYAIAALPRGDNAGIANPRLEYDSTIAQGIRLRVKANTGAAGALAGLELMVQITQVS